MNEYTCKRCGHHWKSILDRKPVVCPRCKSYRWAEEPKICKEEFEQAEEEKAHKGVVE